MACSSPCKALVLAPAATTCSARVFSERVVPKTVYWAAQGAAIERAAAAAGRAAAAAMAAAEDEGAAAGHRTQSEGEGPECPESGERGLTEEEKRERRCGLTWHCACRLCISKERQRVRKPCLPWPQWRVCTQRFSALLSVYSMPGARVCCCHVPRIGCQAGGKDSALHAQGEMYIFLCKKACARHCKTKQKRSYAARC